MKEQKVDLFIMAHEMIEDEDVKLNYKEAWSTLTAIKQCSKELDGEYSNMSEDEMLLEVVRKELRRLDKDLKFK